MRRTRRGQSLVLLVYVGIGVAVAASHDYFRNVNTLREVFAAVLAVVLAAGPTRNRPAPEEVGRTIIRA